MGRQLTNENENDGGNNSNILPPERNTEAERSNDLTTEHGPIVHRAGKRKNDQIWVTMQKKTTTALTSLCIHLNKDGSSTTKRTWLK